MYTEEAIFIGHPELDVHQSKHYDYIVKAPDPMWPGSNHRGAHMDYQTSPGLFLLTKEEIQSAKERISSLEVNMNHPEQWKIDCALRIKMLEK